MEKLTPLAALTPLQSLLLVGTTVSELEPLKQLHALKVVNLNGSKVSSLDLLKRLPALQVLYLSPTVSEEERVSFNHGRAKRNLKPVEIRH